MADSRQSALVSVRTKTCSQSTSGTAFAGAPQIPLGKAWSLDFAELSRLGADQMLGLQASDASNRNCREMMHWEERKKMEPGRTCGFADFTEAIEVLDS